MTPVKAMKIVGVVLLVLILISIALTIVGSSFNSLTGGLRDMGVSVSSAPGYAPSPMATGMGGGGYGYDGAVDYDYAVKQEAAYMPQLSARNVAGTTIYPPSYGAPGDDLEEFEVTQYSAYIETRKLDDTCDAFSELKERSDVIFEAANTYDKGCSFTFKVKHDAIDYVLGWLKDFDPKELSENTYTIKQQVDDFTKEIEVLEKKRDSIDQTLTQALNAYDEITRLATQTQNADALAQIINSKINIIERLTQERININEQLDRYARAKEDQLDRLDYTYFNVTVVENKYVDGEQISESWKQALRMFVWNVNAKLQDLTINMIVLFLLVIQWLIYAVVVLFIAKYGWKFATYIWYR